MSTKKLFNDGWEFTKQAVGSTLETIKQKDISFSKIDLPHDWLIYNTLNLYEDSTGWYRKRFFHNQQQGKHSLLRFEGVYMNCEVYINNQKAGEWKNGYSTFEFDITKYLIDGENEVIVKVVYQSPNSRWYSGAGIYRNVWLKTYANNHLVSDGIYISTRKEKDGWYVNVETEAVLCKEASIKHSILYQGQIIAASENTITTNSISTKTALENKIAGLDRMITISENRMSGSNRNIISSENSLSEEGCNYREMINSQTLYIEKPDLWDIEAPNLYQLRSELIIGGKVIETELQNFGFRTIEADPDNGFLLNGRHVKLKGACEHHDLGCLGAAFNKAAMRRKFKILKEMGVNAVRSSHNMPAVGFMELADEMGILILSEAFDMWEKSKTEYDYARFFKDWAEKDVASWVRRDRNHPSVILWSIGNEIYDTHADEKGQEITRRLMGYVNEHDPKHNALVTICSNYMPWENAQKCADIVKLAGYNYGDKYYEKHHKEHPDWIIYGSETASIVQSRGIYHFPYEQAILSDDDEQCSSLGNSSTSWGAKSAEACIISDRDAKYSMGQFLWSGFDYIGEPTPYHTKNSYFGQIDTAGFPKDSFYIFQAEWTDYKKKPMIHILPYWDFNPGQIIDVRVCTNAPRMQLFLNGKSIGSCDVDHENGKKLNGCWKVPYTPGELRAVAYGEKGEIIATEVLKSFSDARTIALKADKKELLADGQDLIFVTISMKDKDGNPVENANNRVAVSVKGAGRLVGLDNGDSTDYDQYKTTSRRLFSGKLLAVIAAKLIPGEIIMEVSSEGLETQTIELKALPCEKIEGVSVYLENQPLRGWVSTAHACEIEGNIDTSKYMKFTKDIPVRKIELTSESGCLFHENRKEIKVNARLCPENASYKDLEWNVVNDAGISSNIAMVKANGTEAVVTAFGDGAFRLRCMTRNGSDIIRIISQLEFKAEGLGMAYKNPYEFISAGLYDYGKGEVGTGNERGIATARDGETLVGFRNIDFGSYGSDEITLPIFALSGDKYSIQIWEGMPEEEGSSLLADVIYQKPSIWNVYQEETYHLNKRLMGITSICFVLRQKVHIKGFTFKKLNKALAQLMAKECDHIYGDTYHIANESVEGIGNNVSLVFEAMDFGEKGIKKLMICGRSPIEKNTIHVRFKGEAGDSNQVVDFPYSDGYVEREFSLEKVTGKQMVTFLFLPGCNFDFKWFRFEV